MKILYVTLSDITVCSSSNIRNASLIQGLLELGHSVDVVSYRTSNKAQLRDDSFASILDRCRIFSLTGTASAEKVSGGLLSAGTGGFKQKLYRWLRRAYYAWEPVDSLKKIAQTVDIEPLALGDYDVMISSSNPYSVHILAERIKERFFPNGIFWVQYWGDALYLDTLTRRPLLPGRLKKAEFTLLRHSDAIVYTNGVVLQMQKALFPALAERMSFVETPFAFSNATDDGSFKYQVGYFGSFSKSVRDIEPLYAVLSKASYPSVIIGNGDSVLPSTDTVTVLPRASVNLVSQYEQKTRVLVCLCNNLSNKGQETGLIPGKAYHYGATAKAVLVIGASLQVKRFLQGYHRYVFADNNADAIRRELDRLLAATEQSATPLEEVRPVNAAGKMLAVSGLLR